MRSRILKEGFFKNDVLGALSPLARILYAGLWCMADRLGRLEDRPQKIKIECLPYDNNAEVDSLLNELENNPEMFIVRYEAEGGKYIQIRNFLKHQSPHKNEPQSIIPEIPRNYAEEIVKRCNVAPIVFYTSICICISDSKDIAVEDEISSSAESSDDPSKETLIEFPCSGEVKLFRFTRRNLRDLQEAYPNVDVLAEVKRSLVWQKSNGFKTAKGQMKHLFSWMGKANDQPPSHRNWGMNGPAPIAQKMAAVEACRDQYEL